MFAPNDRVRWRHDEPGVDEASLVGKVTQYAPDDNEYLVRWDDGTQEWADADDLVKEES